MDHPLNLPIDLHGVPGGIIPHGHRIAPSTRNLSRHGAARSGKSGSIHALRGKPISLHPLSDYLLTIDRVHGAIACPMKDDGWHNPSKPAHRVKGQRSLLHGIGTSLAHSLE